MKKAIFTLMFVGLGSTAWAQTDTRVQISVLFGYTFADGVSGDTTVAGNGNSYNRVDPADGGNVGLSFGFMVSPKSEIGFMYRRQSSQVEISGPTATTVLGDVNLDSYHGYFAYYFGDPEGRVNPYFLAGFGATASNDVAYTTPGGATGTAQGKALFSSTWGTGVRVNAAKNVALKFGVAWTPTYIKSDATGWWCDPYWGCYVTGNAQYMNQFHVEGAFTFRF